MKAAAVQMTSTRDVRRNLADAGELIREAAEQGAELVVLPENFSFLGATDAERQAAVEPWGDGPAQRFLAEAAERHGVWLVGGTIPILDKERGDRGERPSSRSLLLAPDGRIVAHYDKIHLFDVDASAGTSGRAAEPYKESASTLAGERVVSAATPLGRIGLTICYDIRFPALFHRLSVLGVDVLAVPAAFTVPTGQVHWQPLLQARAIESLVYVVAAGQCGEHAGGRKTYGHSMVIGPWGEILGELENDPGVLCVDLDMIRLSQLRESFPVVRHRRDL
ncbi:MAG TPA: carbon-nitrogen hydrolase family protein [Gammaproteobacteria bacterium]|nr:carbon-nitrogen hydrolase family protein [Gammaproteobacteria bacterium]